MQTNNIKSAVWNVLFRIVCFVIYYLMLIALGVVVFVESFKVVRDLVVLFFETENPIAYLGYILLIIGLSFFALMLGSYLIKPLFSFKKDKKANRIEVNESECPDLYAMIREVAAATHCAMPKRIYLSPDVNACVFYDTSFWSIFFPVKKNLEIGLGLFDETSVEEVKAVIAHEFGHFSQKSMKIGSTVYITNTVLHNLIYTEDSWDRIVDKWCMDDVGMFRFSAKITRSLTNVIKRTTVFVYKFVQKGYLKLSRYMEYDADNISFQCVGSDTAISAMCKIDTLSYKDEMYRNLLADLIRENKILTDYFKGKEIVYGMLNYRDMPVFRHDEQLTKPISLFDVKSRIKVDDVWASHPSLEERMDNAKMQNVSVDKSVESKPAWSLIPRTVAEMVSVNFVSLVRNNLNGQIIYVNDEQFVEWVRQYFEDNFIDERLRPYFGRSLFQFDIDKVVEVPTTSPFTDENALKIATLRTYIADWNVLNQVKDGHIEAEEVLVDGVLYKKDDIPMEKFRREMDFLHEDVVKIFSDIYAYVGSRCDEEKKASWQFSFNAIFYSWYISKHMLASLMNHKEMLCGRLTSVTYRDEDDYEYRQLCGEVKEYENHLKEIINGLDLEWIERNFGWEKIVNSLRDFVSKENILQFSINTKSIEDMFKITNGLDLMVKRMEDYSNSLICDIAIEVLDAEK